MPNLNVGLALAVGLCVPAFASEQTEFYDADGNWIDTQYDGANGAYVSGYLRKNIYDGGCAHAGSTTTPPTGGTIYSCNGGCSRFSSSSYNIVEILPNGSYFYGFGSDAYDEGNSDTYNFICSTSGEWVACQTRTDTSTGAPALVKEVGLRTYCSTGYKETNIGGDEMDFAEVEPYEFCGDPYYYWNSSNSYNFASYIWNYQNCSNSYNYSGCASGYKLSSGRCVSCGSLTNGGYNKDEWHRFTSCNAYCNSGYGYKASTDECVSGGAGQVHMYNYNGEENDWRDCPDGALCDMDGYVYCPVGGFVAHAGDGSATPWCADCPGEWGMSSTYYRGFDEDGTMMSCDTDDGYDWGQGEETDCLWTDVWGTMDEMDSICYELRGSDNTGSYEYRYDDGDWYSCEYSY